MQLFLTEKLHDLEIHTTAMDERTFIQLGQAAEVKPAEMTLEMSHSTSTITRELMRVTGYLKLGYSPEQIAGALGGRLESKAPTPDHPLERWWRESPCLRYWPKWRLQQLNRKWKGQHLCSTESRLKNTCQWRTKVKR